MNDMNVCVLVGRLTREPDYKMVDDETSMCKFSIALNTKTKETERTDFFDVVAWKGLADTCKKYLQKGCFVCVTGRLTYETWDKDGKKQSKVSITATSIQFLDKTKIKQGY